MDSNLDSHLEHYAEKVAERVVELLRESPPIPLDILTPAQAARYLGYTIRSLESFRRWPREVSISA